MKRSVSVATVLLFVLITAGLGFSSLLLPDRAFSDRENRYLSSLPEFSASALFSGDYIDDLEEYISDQFPLRDDWIVLQAGLQRASLRKENNGVYYGESLISTFWTYDEKQYENNLSAVKSLLEKEDGRALFVPVPNEVAVNTSALPFLHPDVSQAGLLSDMEAQLPEGTVVDTLSALEWEESMGSSLYYRTDHHMTTRGAFVVYTQLAQALGLTPYEEEAFTIRQVSDDFTGTLYNKSGIWWTKPDTIEQWTLTENAPDITVDLPQSGEHYDSIYDESALETADEYACFAYGNQPLEVIRSSAEGGKLLLVKDSYAHAVVPFLALHYSEIHMVDLRYYHGDLEKYREENGIGETVVLYNISNFCEDTSAVLVR